MSSETLAAEILRGLESVGQERRTREASGDLSTKVAAVKRYQQARLRLTYADLLQSSRYRPASLFFLEELYGPADFTHRDAQFARIVPHLVRLLPETVVETVQCLTELHALSEQLDSQMGRHLVSESVDAASYVGAWKAVDRTLDRERQVALVLEIGAALDRFAHLPLIGTSLRLMRAPARASGLSDLQHFLEAGLGAFRDMHGAAEFLSTVGRRERALLKSMFEAAEAPNDSAGRQAWAARLGIP